MKIDLKNKTFWVSLASAIVIFVQNICSLFGIDVHADGIMTIINAICGGLIMMGILKTPPKHKQNSNNIHASNISSNDEQN